MIDHNQILLVNIGPGAGTWFAETNSNFLEIVKRWPGSWFGVAGEAINTGDALAYDSITGLVYKADSNGANQRWNCVGIAQNIAAITQEVVYIQRGTITLTHSQPPGTVAYLSDTPGVIAFTPATTTRIVGLYLPNNQMLIDFPSSWRAA